MSARRGGAAYAEQNICLCCMKRQFLNAVPILCVQRFSSVQRNIGFLMIYDIAKAEFPTSSVGAHLYVSRQMEFSCLPLPAP